MKTRYAEIAPYRTKDSSEIRELMHPGQHGGHAQSLAEATVAPGAHTRLHRHARSEEIYHVTAGDGEMVLGTTRLTLAPGDTVRIPPGTAHALYNTGAVPLRVLCACSPPYAHADTELLDAREAERTAPT